MPRGYFAGGAGLALGAGEGEAAGAGAALPAVARPARAGRRGSLGLGARIDPAGVDAAVEGFGHLGVDLAAKAGQAAEGRLDMAAGAAEPVVEIEMAERGIEVVAPHQADHAAAEPDAFGVAARAVDGLGRLDEFVGLALVVLVGVGGIGGRRCLD